VARSEQTHVVLEGCRTWVAVRGTEILGYTGLESDVLQHFYLLPDVRRQGVGTLLLDEAKRDGPGGLRLQVFEQNTEARAFYQRHGFTVLATGDGSGNMENLPDLTPGWAQASRACVML
jgi:ribosomal protein S18 acetylase RimI-like enzyme